MKLRIWLLGSSLTVLGLIGTPQKASAEVDPGCYLAESYCSKGSECCSKVCERGTDGHSYCQ